MPVFKGTYDQTLAAGIAAYRSGNAPAILQVYEVGTATMMQAKKAVIPVSEVFKQAGVPLDEKAFVPTIASYYSDAKTGAADLDAVQQLDAGAVLQQGRVQEGRARSEPAAENLGRSRRSTRRS